MVEIGSLRDYDKCSILTGILSKRKGKKEKGEDEGRNGEGNVE